MSSLSMVDYLRPIVTPCTPALEDPSPARFTVRTDQHTVLVGSAQHALAVDMLVSRGVTAVLNLAPAACADCSSQYRGHNIDYLALDAEDQPGYNLLELHLESATEFLTRVRAANGTVLVQ